jgi:hypothetical protein
LLRKAYQKEDRQKGHGQKGDWAKRGLAPFSIFENGACPPFCPCPLFTEPAKKGTGTFFTKKEPVPFFAFIENCRYVIKTVDFFISTRPPAYFS